MWVVVVDTYIPIFSHFRYGRKIGDSVELQETQGIAYGVARVVIGWSQVSEPFVRCRSGIIVVKACDVVIGWSQVSESLIVVDLSVVIFLTAWDVVIR